jgi:hypothetical protein
MISQVLHLNLGVLDPHFLDKLRYWIRIRMKYMLPIITLYGVGLLHSINLEKVTGRVVMYSDPQPWFKAKAWATL